MMSRSRMVAVTAGLAAMLALGGCTTRGPAVPGPGGGVPGADAASAGNGNVDLGGPLGGRPTPDFTLVNQFGQLMSLSQFRGKVVLLSWKRHRTRRCGCSGSSSPSAACTHVAGIRRACSHGPGRVQHGPPHGPPRHHRPRLRSGPAGGRRALPRPGQPRHAAASRPAHLEARSSPGPRARFARSEHSGADRVPKRVGHLLPGRPAARSNGTEGWHVPMLN